MNCKNVEKRVTQMRRNCKQQRIRLVMTNWWRRVTTCRSSATKRHQLNAQVSCTGVSCTGVRLWLKWLPLICVACMLCDKIFRARMRMLDHRRDKEPRGSNWQRDEWGQQWMDTNHDRRTPTLVVILINGFHSLQSTETVHRVRNSYIAAECCCLD